MAKKEKADFFLFLDAPFITSLVKKKAAPPPQQTSSALESFMKFDRKYGVKGSTLAAAAAKTDSETEPEISEEPKSPSRIASELEEKVRVFGIEGTFVIYQTYDEVKMQI